jgi:hypothetical protein
MDTSDTVLVAVVESLDGGQVSSRGGENAHPLVVFRDETVRSWFVVNQAGMLAGRQL